MKTLNLKKKHKHTYIYLNDQLLKVFFESNIDILFYPYLNEHELY